MTVTFYSNKADNRKVDKTGSLTTLATLQNVNFKMDENRGEPQLELAYNATIEHANYCYISELGYYYHLSEPILSTQRMLFNCNTDLLMTYKNEILNLKCIIARQAEKYNVYLRDDRYPVTNKQAVVTLSFPGGFNKDDTQIIMTVNGGAGTV